MSTNLKSFLLPDQGLCRLRNRFSVLLAASRRHLSPPEFSRLLQMQGKGDLWLLARPQVSEQRRQLARQLNKALDDLLQEMEGGEFPRACFWNASRSYGQVFGDHEQGEPKSQSGSHAKPQRPQRQHGAGSQPL